MLKIFGFGQAKPARPTDAGPSAFPATMQHSGASSVFPDTAQHTSTQRELVRVVLKDTLRLRGIPSGLIGCEVNVASRIAGKEELSVQLVLLKWNEAVLHYAPVIQQELIKNLDRFDPAVSHANYVYSWRFGPEYECPIQSMPTPDAWNSKVEPVKLAPVATVMATPTPVPPAPKPKFDLPSSERDSMPSDFAPTQVGPM
ncbi:MAG TPA: hypothetical protein PK497_03420 [Burkholderiaceae bacterium]|nr:hypothetical protein [Burkholderiaceae bacterium]HPH14875.1 hypothetical protein [Burkholderiaceae bacterium]